MATDQTPNDTRLLDLARRLLDGEAIDSEKEGIADPDVRRTTTPQLPVVEWAPS